MTESPLTSPTVVNSVPAKVVVVAVGLAGVVGGDGERGGVDGQLAVGVGDRVVAQPAAEAALGMIE